MNALSAIAGWSHRGQKRRRVESSSPNDAGDGLVTASVDESDGASESLQIGAGEAVVPGQDASPRGRSERPTRDSASSEVMCAFRITQFDTDYIVLKKSQTDEQGMSQMACLGCSPCVVYTLASVPL